MSHIYRCMSCRTRNTFTKPVHEFKKGRTCRNCAHPRFYVDKERRNRKACGCMGYHFPHRPGSGCCDSNPAARENRMKREGHDEEASKCPF